MFALLAIVIVLHESDVIEEQFAGTAFDDDVSTAV
jgi:hypothetical protein